MRKALLTSTILVLAVSAAAGCSILSGDDEPDDSASTGGTGGTPISLGGGGSGTGTGGSSTSGTTGTGDGGAVSTEPEGCETLVGLPSNCGATKLQAEYRTAEILLVVDKSGSMMDQPAGFATNKWDALTAALDGALNSAIGAGDVNFGLVLYPHAVDHTIPLEGCTDDCCEVPTGSSAVVVPIEDGPVSVPAIMDAINNTEPGGGTPTAYALASALDYFTTGDGLLLQGDRYVLLATDGGPNCNPDNTCDGDRCTPNLDSQCSVANCCAAAGLFCLDDVAVVEQITKLKDAGVTTFVVGIPGTEVYSSYLDSFAQASGQINPNAPPDYYAVAASGGVEALEQTFVDITTFLIQSCDVLLPSAPMDIEQVNVAVDCELVTDWDISPDNDSLIVVNGATCTFLEESGAGRIDVVYGCPRIK